MATISYQVRGIGFPAQTFSTEGDAVAHAIAFAAAHPGYEADVMAVDDTATVGGAPEATRVQTIYGAETTIGRAYGDGQTPWVGSRTASQEEV